MFEYSFIMIGGIISRLPDREANQFIVLLKNVEWK